MAKDSGDILLKYILYTVYSWILVIILYFCFLMILNFSVSLTDIVTYLSILFCIQNSF